MLLIIIMVHTWITHITRRLNCFLITVLSMNDFLGIIITSFAGTLIVYCSYLMRFGYVYISKCTYELEVGTRECTNIDCCAIY